MFKKLFILFFSLLIGLILFLYLFGKAGVIEVLVNIKLLKYWQWLIILFLSFLNFFIIIFRWKYIFQGLGRRGKFGQFVKARLGDFALSYITPIIYIGGEGARLFIAKKETKAPWHIIFASIALDRISEILAIAIFFFIIGGIFIFLNGYFFWGFLTLCLAFFIFFTILILIKISTFKNFLEVIVKILTYFRKESTQGFLQFFNLIEEYLYKKRKRFLISIFFSVLSLIIWLVLGKLIIEFLGYPLSFGKVFIVRVFGAFSGLFPIPANLGVLEGAYILGFSIFNIPSTAGLAFSLIFRIIDIVFIILGLIFISHYLSEIIYLIIMSLNKDQKYTPEKIRKIFLQYFKKKGHKIIPSSSLIPADPTVLFTTAGMQQFVPYLSGESEPPYLRAVSVQKCFRTTDIDDVGDERHQTFFEMLGNWSFGDYFKKEAIKWAYDLLIKKFKLKKDKIWITVFKGYKENGKVIIPPDEESVKVWQELGIPKERIKSFGMKENFWGPVGETGPCGPCTEIHYDKGEEAKERECSIEDCGPNCECGRFIEVWNLVFMEYNRKIDQQKEEKKYYYIKLPKKNVDTGMGLERLLSILVKKRTAFETELFQPIIKKMEELSYFSYQDNPKPFRIIADHIRGICFLIADGVLPSKEDRGYVLRRLIRRSIRYGHLLSLPKNFLIELANLVIDQYSQEYPELKKEKTNILVVLQNEEEKFSKTLKSGLKEFKKLIEKLEKIKSKIIPGEDAFFIYETYGFPLELIEEMAQEKGFKIDHQGYEQARKKHQQISRAGVKRKFGGVGISETDTPEERERKTKLHTATHLLQQALRDVLGNEVRQMGSDINPERLRFDFSFKRKLTDEEIKKVEQIVNQKIKEDLPVRFKEMSYDEAIKQGALAFFKERYPKIVKVYFIGDYSKEICGGPHVKRTSQLKEFKILKQESVGAGIRRIKATLSFL